MRWEGADSILIDVCAACVWEHKSTCFAPSNADGAPTILDRPKYEEPLPDVLHARVRNHSNQSASLSPTNE